MSRKTRICFVCLGNIIRSPLSEHLFRHLAHQAGAGEYYEVSSAGTSSYHVGEPPDARMRRVAARHGLQYDGRSRQFLRQDFDRLDLVIAMDQENHSDLHRLARNVADKAKIHTLREYDPHGGPRAGVPDPYYGGIDGFEETYAIIERSCQGWLQFLESRRLGE